MTPRREANRDALYDLLADTPAGVTIDQIMGSLEVNHRTAKEAVHDLRELLGEDEINVPATPRGERERWLYQLVGTLDGCREWVANRIGDTETRLRTIQSVMRSLVNATDGRTTDGRRARIIETALRHLVEDLDNLTAP
jgi:hypothetical protein